MSKVSVIIPTYNYAQYIKQAIDSVLSQTFRDLEIIVVDDGSTDNTREILQGYGDKIKYFYQENKGISKARNLAISKATGEYIALLDADDVWLPIKLERQLDIIENNPDLGFVCSAALVVNGDGNYIDCWGVQKKRPETFEYLFNLNYIQPLSMVIRRRCLDEVGYFDPRLPISQDYDLVLRLTKRFKFFFIDYPLVKYRVHDGNTSKDSKQRLRDHLLIIQKPEISGDMSFLKKHIRKARAYYYFAEMYLKKQDFKEAGKHFLKSFFVYPLIGSYYWPVETAGRRFSFPYRVFKVPFMGLQLLLNGTAVGKHAKG